MIHVFHANIDETLIMLKQYIFPIQNLATMFSNCLIEKKNTQTKYEIYIGFKI